MALNLLEGGVGLGKLACQFGKAIKSLGSHGVAPFSPETTQALRDLHPEGDPVAIRSSFPEGFEISRNDGLVFFFCFFF